MVKTDKCFWCGSKDLKKIAERKDSIPVCKCRQCGLLLVGKKPENLVAYYEGEDYYNPGDSPKETGYLEHYDLISPVYLFWQSALLSEIAEGKTASLLEVGCATGNLLSMISKFNKNITTVGIDISEYGVSACKRQGIEAYQEKINTFKYKNKFDIIFSSETMEHVDDLKDFLVGVEKNLSSKGTYAFYVPSVEEKQLVAQGRDYISLGSSLEHLIYFTKEFFEKALPQFFSAEVVVEEFTSPYGNSLVGIVSRDKAVVRKFKQFFADLEKNSLSGDESYSSDQLFNFAVIASKFGKFSLAAKLISLLEEKNDNDKAKFLAKGIYSFNKGQIEKSNLYFLKYIENETPDLFVTKLLLANERALNKMLSDETRRMYDLASEVNHLNDELFFYKTSRPIKVTFRLREYLKVGARKLKALYWRIRTRLLRTMPAPIRRIVKNILKLHVLQKKVMIKNVFYGEKPLVSVVTPFYNQGATIEETINSVLAQTFQNFEYIIINDGSDDQNTEILKGINVPKVKIYHQSNKGKGSPAAARNAGIKKAKGKYVVCVDSDDMLDPTYLEKLVVVLESDPNIDLASTWLDMFGIENKQYRYCSYDPRKIPVNNMVSTAAMFSKEAWEQCGGYKTGIGYEDWEFWMNLAEHGFWGRLVPEAIFKYRTVVSSRYKSDAKSHNNNVRKLRSLHPRYRLKVITQLARRKFILKILDKKTAFINLNDKASYAQRIEGNPDILVAVPWMTFGGAETLIYNFCREIKDRFNISFVTGLPSENEWEYKFREISPNIYHLSNLFLDKKMYLEFVSNYIITRQIKVLHIIHTNFLFEFLPELKKRHPDLKIVATLFNDRVEYFEQSIRYHKYIDVFSSDNNKVGEHFRRRLPEDNKIEIIANGIDCYTDYNSDIYERSDERFGLSINERDLAVFYVGRLSEEKKPDVFVEVAKKVQEVDKNGRIKFFMIGDGPLRAKIEKEIHKAGNSNLKYLGYQKEVAKYLSAADVFVLPSTIEGFPLSILEAMAMKVVVVASNVGAVSDVITSGKSGFVVDPASVKEITETILRLNQDRGLLKRTKNKAREEVEHKYSNIILGEKYSNLYQREF